MSYPAPNDKTLVAMKMAFHIFIAKSLSSKELTHEHRLPEAVNTIYRNHKNTRQIRFVECFLLLVSLTIYS
jgi:hypothetical protein